MPDCHIAGNFVKFGWSVFTTAKLKFLYASLYHITAGRFQGLQIGDLQRFAGSVFTDACYHAIMYTYN